MAWRALLEGDDAARAKSAIERIVDELAGRHVDGGTLGNGDAGLALLHGYLAAAFDDEAAADRAAMHLERAIPAIVRRPRPWLFAGYAGSGFVLQQLAPVLGEQDAVLAEHDALVGKWLEAEHWNYPYELMFGLVGLGVYASERDDAGLVARAVACLDSIATRDDAGIAWRAMNDDDHAVYWNLGLAHGHAGVVGWLADVCARPDAPPRARPLLEGAVAWLRGKARENAPRFVPMLDRDITDAETADGWCYGDLSTAVVLARAAIVLRDRAMLDAALGIAHEVARDGDRAMPLLDAAFCHGTAGHAHLFHRLGLAVRDEALLAAARASYLRTLDRLGDLSAIEPGLRGGLAGIALALLAATTDLEPRWDRAFLVELPVDSGAALLGFVRGDDGVERAQ